MDTESRFEEAESILKVFCEDEDKIKKMKSRVLTLMLRQLSSNLSLTKNQNNQMVHFIKCMIRFVAPDNQEISQRIFASHDSCRRQSLKDQERKHTLCKTYMEECLFFSLAVDTALFKNENLISCSVRFSFVNRVIELPLFIRSCPVSSGCELARFIFDTLTERNAKFGKLVSISTDGAANMLGKYNGVTPYFKRLVDQFCRGN